MLTDNQRTRYSRHLSLPGFTEVHQERLAGSSVLVIGAGGLGSSAILYLAAAGVGRIGLVDDDYVDVSNLQRQIIHDEAAIGKSKAHSAAARATALNSACTVDIQPVRLNASNAVSIFGDYELVIDGSDNLPTRYLANDACRIVGIPLIYGSVFRSEGQLSVFGYDGGPCYRCLFPTPPPPDLVQSCESAGVLGVVPGLVGIQQASEAIKIITGLGEVQAGHLVVFDCFSNEYRKLRIRKNEDCPVCSVQASSIELVDYELFCGIRPVPLITATEVVNLLADERARPFLLDVREDHERQLSNIGGVHIPMSELRSRVNELPDRVLTRPMVVYCRSGVRSANAVRIIQVEDDDPVFSLDGGLVEWKQQIDPAFVVD